MMTGQLVSFGARCTALAAAHPNAVAVTLVHTDGGEQHLTWGDLETWSNRLARRFLAHGVTRETMVVIGLPNCLEHYPVALAAWKCGACTLPASARMPDHEFGQMMALLPDRCIVADRAGAALSRAEVLATRDDAQLDAAPLPDIMPHPGKAIGSGGSTGRPKIIVDPNPWGRVPGAITGLLAIGFQPRQVQLVAGPLYHNTPFSWGHIGLFEDQRLIVMEHFDAALAVDLIERHRCNFMFLAPTMMLRIHRLPDIHKRDLSSIRAILQTAAATPIWLKREWIKLVGAEKITEAFGSSEGTGHTRIRGDEWLLHSGSVGRPENCDVLILDTDFSPLPTGEIGEIFFRPACHPAPTYRYIGAAPARTTPDGFVGVGDLGYIDEEGYVFLVDRRTDMIVTGGANVYPAEVEAALTEHPAVTDVAVIGLADEEWGRRVHAIIEPADIANPPAAIALAAWLRERLTPYKIPKNFEFVAALPRNAAGKIRRSALVAEREQAEAAR
jgi:bile acid-coenzyme A ligase